MKKGKYLKEDYIRFRIDSIEKARLDKLISLTRQQRSDLYRESIFNYMKENFPQCLTEE